MVDNASTSIHQQRLVELLLQLFSPDELRRFVRHRYLRLSKDLREDASHLEQTENVVQSLLRHGELDNDFFAGLRGERGKRTAEIDDIAALFLSRGPGARASTEATPLDAPILELERRIAALAQDGLDAQQERAELLQLRGQRRAYPAPARGLLLAGRYTLDIELGHGGFASVWRAQDREAHRRVALKILHSHHAGDRIRRDRFARGMRTMRSLDHPNILRVHEPEVSANGFVFAVLELVSGGDLHEAFRNHQLPPDQIWPILLAICDGLGLVHDRNLVHRDIKPGNILLTETGTPFLTDFDLVLDHETAGGTRTGALGSVVYTPPELWHDAHQATTAADVYSLAMTAVFAYQGAHPSPNIIRYLNAELDELDLTPALRDVLRHALAWRPEDRYPDARALGEALQAALARPVPAPLPAHDYQLWENSFLAAQGPQQRKQVLHAALWDRLNIDTGALQRTGCSAVPGTQWISYAIAATPAKRSARTPARSDRPNFARLILDGPVLPHVEKTLWIAERLRAALLRHVGDQPCAVLTGKDDEDGPLQGHRHAFFLPQANQRGEIDHILVHARDGFDTPAVHALRSLRVLYGLTSHPVHTTMIALGRAEALEHPQLPLHARTHWESLTPFIPPRCPKERRGQLLDAHEDQLRRLCGLVLGVEPIAIHPFTPEEARERRLHAYRRERRRGGPVPGRATSLGYRLEFAEPVRGPIALGYGAHFGLGQFIPQALPLPQPSTSPA
jgi:hypothetical protein